MLVSFQRKKKQGRIIEINYFLFFSSLALKIALGSLYKDDIILKPVQMIGVLAAGTLLQLVRNLSTH